MGRLFYKILVLIISLPIAALGYSIVSFADINGKEISDQLKDIVFWPATFAPEAYSNTTPMQIYIPTPSDACEKFTDEEISNIKGKVILIDRGTCPFTTKGVTAEHFGAGGMILINNVEGEINEVPGGSVDPRLVIPILYISLKDGNSIKSLLQEKMLSVVITYDKNWRAYNSIRKGEKMLEKNSKDVNAAMGLVYAYEEIGGNENQEKVLSYLEIIASEGREQLGDEDFSAAMLQLGLRLVQIGKVKEATELKGIKEDDFKYWNEIGSELYMLGHREEGTNLLKKAKNIDPRGFIKHFDLGKYYINAGDPIEKVKKELSTFLAVFPLHQEAKEIYTNYLLKKKDKDGFNQLKELVFFHKKNADRLRLARIYLKKGQLELAELEFNAVLKNESENEEAMKGLKDIADKKNSTDKEKNKEGKEEL